MKRSKSIILAVSVTLAAILVSFLMFRLSQNRADSKETTTRHTSVEIKERFGKLRKERGGLPSEIALEKATTEEQREYWKKEIEFENQTPEQALTDARSKLEELTLKLSETTDPEERERLERHRRLTEKIVSKLEGMFSKANPVSGELVNTR